LDGLKVDKVKWQKMLDEYYEYNGWDKKTGIPTRARLESLGLGYIADELEKMEKTVAKK
jgi:aldehyde:ferredoxin oxidoreductase